MTICPVALRSMIFCMYFGFGNRIIQLWQCSLLMVARLARRGTFKKSNWNCRLHLHACTSSSCKWDIYILRLSCEGGIIIAADWQVSGNLFKCGELDSDKLTYRKLFLEVLKVERRGIAADWGVSEGESILIVLMSICDQHISWTPRILTKVFLETLGPI